MSILNPSISVIVPVYNVEKFLPKCIESIMKQTFKNIEIILLNDGSTDNSLEICNTYAEKDERIKVYSHSNMGLGPTRNRGLEIATGDYLAFVDSDDYISQDGLASLYKKAVENNLDIVQGETFLFKDGASDEKLRKSLKDVKNITVTADSSEYFYKYYYFNRVYSHNAWDKIYKRNFVLENKLQFGDNKKIFAEDNWFQLQALRCNPAIGFVSHRFYLYRQQENSIMHQPKKNLVKRHAQMISDYTKLIKSEKGKNCEDKVCSLVALDVLTMEALNQLILNGNYKNFADSVNTIKDYPDLYKSIGNICKNCAFKLYSDRGRKLYTLFIGLLYFMGCYKFANYIAWNLYKNR